MKCSIICCLVLGLVACSYAVPYQKRMVYYQPPRMYYNPMRSAPLTQRLMYVQYVQPSQANARPSNGVSTFVAGDTVATGSYLKDCDPVQDNEEEQQIEDEPTVIYDGNSAHSVAEAYPAEEESEFESSQGGYNQPRPVDEDDSQVQEKDQREYAYPQPLNPEIEQAAVPAVPIVPVKAPAPVTKPPRRYLPPQKKVIVQLEDPKPESDYAPEVRPSPAREPAKARKPVNKPGGSKGGSDSKPAQSPSGTFFPINFGGTQGGAIAIANSYSTGTGGSATSHAIAYGSPDSARARSRPVVKSN